MAEVVKCALAGDAGIWDRLLAAAGSEGALREGVALDRPPRRRVQGVHRRAGRAGRLRFAGSSTRAHHRPAMENSGGYGASSRRAVAMGLAWEAILGMKLGVTTRVGRRHRLPPHRHGVSLDDPGVALTSIGCHRMDKKRRMSTWTCRWSPPGPLRAAARPLRRSAGTARDPREIRERSIAREINIRRGMWPRRVRRVRTSFSSGERCTRSVPPRNCRPAVPAEAGRRFGGTPRRSTRIGRGGASRRAEPERAPTGTRAASIVRT